MEQIAETIKTFFAGHYEVLLCLFGIFFIISAWCNWDWIYAPPYNSIKNPIGFWFGRNAFRFSVFATGVLVIALSILIFYLNLSK